jgi:hypothetical protein
MRRVRRKSAPSEMRSGEDERVSRSANFPAKKRLSSEVPQDNDRRLFPHGGFLLLDLSQSNSLYPIRNFARNGGLPAREGIRELTLARFHPPRQLAFRATAETGPGLRTVRFHGESTLRRMGRQCPESVKGERFLSCSLNKKQDRSRIEARTSAFAAPSSHGLPRVSAAL